MSKRVLMLCLMSLFSFFGIRDVAANDGLPDNLQTITVDNASQIQELSSMGGILQGQLRWSPDGIHLAVGTSEEIQVYDSQNLNAPLTVINVAGTNFSFNESGEIVVDSQRWGIETGQLMGDDTPIAPVVTPDINLSNPDDETFLLTISRSDGSTRNLSLDNQYQFSEIVFSSDEKNAVIVLDLWEGDYHRHTNFQLWNIADNTFIADFLVAYETYYTISFFSDDELLLLKTSTGLHDSSIIWDTRTGERVFSSNGYMLVHFSPNGELLALAGGGGITLWSNRELGIIHRSSEAWQPDLMVFSPDSDTIATPLNNSIVLWDVSSEQIPQEHYLIFETTEAAINNLLYNPDGRYIASIERDGIVEVFDAETGIQQARLNVEDDFSHQGVRFSPDSHFLRTRDIDGNAYLLDIENDTTRMIELPLAAVINNDWTQAVYWEDGIVRIISLETEEISDIEVIPEFYGNIIGFSPDSGLVMFRGDSVRGYDLYSTDKVFEQSIPENHRVKVQFNSDGSQFIIFNDSRANNSEDPIEIWDTNNWNEPIASVVESGYLGYEFLYSPDNHYISELWGYCGHGGGGIFYLRDAQTGERVTRLGPDTLCGPYDHVFTSDSEWLITTWDTTIILMKMDETIAQSLEDDNVALQSTNIFNNNPGRPLRELTLSPNDEILAVSVTGVPFSDIPIPDPQIEIFSLPDLQDSNNQTFYELDKTIIPDATHAIFSPDSRYILTDNGFWNAQTGEQLSTVSGTIASFSPDGTILATYDAGLVHLWDVDALLNGSELALLTVDIEDVEQLAFNPDGTLLFIKRAGDVRLWGIS